VSTVFVAETPGLDVVHATADCAEAARHGDVLEEWALDVAVAAIHAGYARPCGACIGRAPGTGHLVPADG
jgi:hypothetical protein